jgi:hypothetical protein
MMIIEPKHAILDTTILQDKTLLTTQGQKSILFSNEMSNTKTFNVHHRILDIIRLLWSDSLVNVHV